MNERISHEMGGITLAVLTNVNTTTYRATATFLDTAASQTCTFTPSGGHGEMPLEGSLCAVYRKGNFYCQFIKELNDFTPTTDLSPDQRLSSGSEIVVGTAPVLEQGEMYIGRYGRAVFNNAGSVSITTQMGNMGLQLNDKTQISTLMGNNYTLTTPDSAIRIATTSSLPTTYGDSIRIEKNIPVPYITPGELAVYTPTAVVPSLAYIEIDEFNAITASVLAPGAAVNSIMTLDELGNVEIGNELGNFSVDPLGEVSIFSTSSTNVKSLTSVSLTAALSGGAQIELSADGQVYAGNNTSSLTLDPTGDVTISGDKIVGIEGTGGVKVTGLTVNLNNGLSLQGVARIGDVVTLSPVTDPVFWAYMTSIQAVLVAIYAAITESTGGLTSPTVAAATLAILASAPIPVVGAFARRSSTLHLGI